MIQLLGLFLLLIALKLVVSNSNSPIATSFNGLVDNIAAIDALNANTASASLA